MRLSILLSSSLLALALSGYGDNTATRPAAPTSTGAAAPAAPAASANAAAPAPAVTVAKAAAPTSPPAPPAAVWPPLATALVEPASIAADHYVQPDAEGHLVRQGKRVRFWGAIGGLPSNFPKFAPEDTAEQKIAKVQAAYADSEALVQRLVDLGFNLNRMWHDVKDDYTPGDGSRADIVDHFFSVMKRRGLSVWGAGINGFGKATAKDVGVIDEPATAAAWSAAISGWGKDGVEMRDNLARRWDPRLEALAISRRAELATHLNRHTGLRYCDDPLFVAWELSNEEWWISKMVGGGFRKLPAFFQESLQRRWSAFLTARYADEQALVKRWGKLLPGESLASGSVQILPLAGEQDLSSLAVDETARKALAEAAAGNPAQKFTRDDFARERGEDVMAFFVDLHVSSKRREAVAFKKLGRSTALCPLAWDTGIGYEIQAQWLHQNADMSSHDAYVNGWGWPRKRPESFKDEQCRWLWDVETEAVKANAGPWNDWLRKPPGIAQGVPWLEHNKAPKQPYMGYETQIQQPAKYRADYPLRLAALASIQDWDGIAWHYYAPPSGIADPQKWVSSMDVTVGGHPQGYHYTFDEVQTAQMRAAGLIWRQELLKSAAKPTTFIFGRKALYDPASMDYGHSYGRRGLDMMYTVYQHGVRLLIDPTREDDEVQGPVVSFDDRQTHNPYTPTPEITFDWKKGFLRFDAPGAVAFTGHLPAAGGKVVFANGIELSDCAIDNPPGIYDPVTPEDGYLAFSLLSEDGKPLAECKNASLALNSTSFNSGFALSKGDFEGNGATASPLYASAGDVRQRGTLPVLVARVAGTVKGKALAGFRWTAYDWTMKPIAEGKVKGETLRVPSDKPIFIIKLVR